MAGVAAVSVGGIVTATRRSSSRPSASKRAPSKKKRSGSTRPPSVSTRARRPAQSRPPATVRALAAVSAAGRGHGADVAGLLAIALGLVAGLGIYLEAAGPVGRGVADGVGALVGAARVLAPPLLIATGVLILWARRHAVDEEDHPIAHIAVGGALVMLAGLGLLHQARHAPRLAAPKRDLSDAAGFIGALVGQPLRSALGPWGAALVLLAVGLIGLLVLTRTTVRTAAGRTATGVAAVVRSIRGAVGRLARRLTDLQADADDAGAEPQPVRRGGMPTYVGPDARVSPYDQDADNPSARQRKVKELIVVPPASDGQSEQLAIDLGPGAKQSTWKLPPAKLLGRTGGHSVDRQLVEETGLRLEHALAEHGVETRLVGMVVGPTVTRYELELGPGVKVSRVTSLHKDIAYAMATPDVRILAPIPGKQAIGVEIPNVRKQLVTIGDILISEEARKANHPLEVAIGRNIDGRSVMANLASMPHILIAGATGAGKSSCLNSLLTSILMRSTPDQVRMILVDPKRVEMGQYNKLPHLLTEVVTNPKKAANALAWAVREMERRYDLLAEVGFRDVTGYNAAFDRGDLVDPRADLLGPEAESVTTYPRLPFIIVVIDELADLMMVAARDVEESICRLAQMARAVGIHLVIATQRPSVNIITGLIKANVPARLAFAVSSVTDSRVILDQPGAERLLGRGDMLLLGPSSSVAQRIQGSWVTEEEVRAVVGHWRRQAPEIAYDDDKVQGTEDAAVAGFPYGQGAGGGSGDEDDESLLRQAMELVVRSQLGSTSMLQRKLRVGFARAGRLMDLLEQRGVVGPSEGSKARAVLMTVEELDGEPGSSGGMVDAPALGD